MRLCVLTPFFISLLCLASSLSAAISEKAWVDLPEARLLTSFIKENGEQRDLLNNKISAYHAIAKTRVEALSDRISALDNILAELALLSPKEASHPKAKHLVRLVEKKRWYLNELMRIYREDATSYAALQQHHTDISKFQLGSLRPLFLANKLMYDAKLPGYWGLYWMETIDPSHRQLMPYYIAWSSIPSPRDPFFMWLKLK